MLLSNNNINKKYIVLLLLISRNKLLRLRKHMKIITKDKSTAEHVKMEMMIISLMSCSHTLTQQVRYTDKIRESHDFTTNQTSTLSINYTMTKTPQNNFLF